MFVVKPGSVGELSLAIMLIKNYMVDYTTETYNGHVVLIVRKYTIEGRIDDEMKAKLEGDLALAEMAFSMNYHQDGRAKLCDVCKMEIERTGEGKDTCGHLTFTHPIERR